MKTWPSNALCSALFGIVFPYLLAAPAWAENANLEALLPPNMRNERALTVRLDRGAVLAPDYNCKILINNALRAHAAVSTTDPKCASVMNKALALQKRDWPLMPATNPQRTPGPPGR